MIQVYRNHLVSHLVHTDKLMSIVAGLHLIFSRQMVPSIISGTDLEPFGLLVWQFCALAERHAPLALEYKAINIYYLMVCKQRQPVSVPAG